MDDKHADDLIRDLEEADAADAADLAYELAALLSRSLDPENAEERS
jgi:hypothetical protein